MTWGWTEWENASDKGLRADLIQPLTHGRCLPMSAWAQQSGILSRDHSLIEVVGKEGLIWTE